MKRIVFLVMMLAMVGCGATRNTLKSQSHSIVESTETTTTDTSESTDEKVKVITDIDEGETVTTEVLEYDTSLPVDRETGTPPLKRKTTQTRERQTNIQQEQTTDTQTEKAGHQEQETTTTAESRTDDKTEQKRGLNVWQAGLIGVGLLALLAILFKIILGRIKK